MRLYVHDRLAGFTNETCWRVARLLACSVDPALTGDTASADGKVSADRFAAEVDLGVRLGITTAVLLHGLAAWRSAADAGLVPSADTLRPDDVDRVPLPEAPWADYYTPVGMMIQILDREEN